MGAENGCVLCIFGLLNATLFTFATVISTACIWFIVNPNSLASILGEAKVNIQDLHLDNFYYLIYIVLALAVAVLIIGFFGCCGSCCKSVCLLSLYFLFIFLLFGIELAAIIFYFVNKDKLLEGFQLIYKDQLIGKYNTVSSVKTVVDNIQSNLNCCGASGCQDFLNYGIFPSSCHCDTQAPIGCATLVWNSIENNLVVVLAIAVAVLVVELLIMIFSCCLISGFRAKNRVVET